MLLLETSNCDPLLAICLYWHPVSLFHFRRVKRGNVIDTCVEVFFSSECNIVVHVEKVGQSLFLSMLTAALCLVEACLCPLCPSFLLLLLLVNDGPLHVVTWVASLLQTAFRLSQFGKCAETKAAVSISRSLFYMFSHTLLSLRLLFLVLSYLFFPSHSSCHFDCFIFLFFGAVILSTVSFDMQQSCTKMNRHQYQKAI